MFCAAFNFIGYIPLGHFPSENLGVSFCYGQKIKLEIEMMNNTALRAGTQSADNTHMVFANGFVK